jgi:hypothetical protein
VSLSFHSVWHALPQDGFRRTDGLSNWNYPSPTRPNQTKDQTKDQENQKKQSPP